MRHLEKNKNQSMHGAKYNEYPKFGKQNNNSQFDDFHNPGAGEGLGVGAFKVCYSENTVAHERKELTMIFMIGGIIIGIILGVLVVLFVPQNVLGWVVVGLGAVALVLIIPGMVAILIPGDAMFSPAITIPLGIACVVSGIGALRKNYRSWQVWLGLGLGSIPVLFWITFSIDEILYPH